MIAITGAAGFIGSCLAHKLAQLGQRYHLLLVDHPLTRDKLTNWVGLDRFCFVTHERFLDALRYKNLPIEVIFHLGACSRTTEVDWAYLSRNNVEYSQELWEWCVEANCPFYYASSAATYGDGQLGFDDRIPPSALLPLNLYGKSKNDFDRWVFEEIEQERPTPPAWAGLKFFNVYGPREIHKGRMASVVWQAHRQILESDEVRLFKSNNPAFHDGGQMRDFVFVEDCIDHLLWLWENPGVHGLFNSGSAVARTFDDLARSVFAALDRAPRIRYVEMPEGLQSQYQYFTQADMSKLKNEGFTRPATSLEEGVRRSITENQNNPSHH